MPTVRPCRAYLALFICLLLPQAASAQLTRIIIDQRQEVNSGQPFGTAGPYERLIGRAFRGALR
jgi:hypothetical protein